MNPSSSDPAVTIRDVPERSRYEMYVGDERAGLITYERRAGVITFVHTEVDDAFEGRGLGSQLARAVLDAARAHGETVRPRCPFIASFLARHPEYADLVDPAFTPS